MRKDKLKGFVVLYKYAAVAAFLMMFIHVGLLLLGVRLGIAQVFASLSFVPWVVSMMMSDCLGFCNLHKACLVYVGLTSFCIKYQADGAGFGELLLFARWFLFAAGVVITSLLYVKRFCVENGRCEERIGTSAS